jgi:sulfide dehydrogenase [flavocytochrome c] flavoprotein chain
MRRTVSLGLAAALLARRAPAARRAHVIVVGAGFGGATCAKYLRRLSPQCRVTLIDERAAFLTGPRRNLVIAGLAAPASIERRLETIAAAHGVAGIEARVREIDPVARKVITSTGKTYGADFIVAAPGIALRWDAIEGLNDATSAAMPHAWTGDDQVAALRLRLKGLADGTTLLISAPPNPYRCPPGPYERASLCAWALQASGRRHCKILIADAKDDFSKSALFKLEWDLLYPGMIDWQPRKDGGEVVRVDAAQGKVWRRGDTTALQVDLASIIPPQRAADLAAQSDLVDESGWCPVHAESFESTRHPGIHVLGDAAVAAPMPKSAFAANSQAKLCASAIAAAIDGSPPPQARFLNTCYSMVSAHEAISVSGYYAAANGRLTAVHEDISPLSAAPALRQREAAQAAAWYRNITTDSFGT